MFFFLASVYSLNFLDFHHCIFYTQLFQVALPLHVVLTILYGTSSTFFFFTLQCYANWGFYCPSYFSLFTYSDLFFIDSSSILFYSTKLVRTCCSCFTWHWSKSIKPHNIDIFSDGIQPVWLAWNKNQSVLEILVLSTCC